MGTTEALWFFSPLFWWMIFTFWAMSLHAIILGGLFMLALLASGCWAADVAEKYGKSDFAAFIAGMLVPYFFPAWYSAVLKRSDLKAAAKPVPEVKDSKQLTVQVAEPEPPPPQEYGFEFFAALPAESNGARFGDFALMTVNGDRFACNEIRKLYPDRAVFVFEIDGTARSIRLKYDNIKTFTDNTKRDEHV